MCDDGTMMVEKGNVIDNSTWMDIPTSKEKDAPEIRSRGDCGVNTVHLTLHQSPSLSYLG